MTRWESSAQSADAALPATEEFVAEQPPALTRAALFRLRATRDLSTAAWREAMDFCGFIPNGEEWRAYWRYVFLLGGALFFVAGVIFFIAWNWAEMHRFGKMALVGAIVAAAGAGAVWRGPDSLSGRVLLLCCGISVGPLLAVFGQTYQTGAELWELFRVWTLVLFALALAGKQAALWFVTWLAANLFVMLWLGRAMDDPLHAIGMFSLLPECVLTLALAVAAWEFAAARSRGRRDSVAGMAPSHGWLQSRWLPRLLFFDLIVRLTMYVCLWILVPSEIRFLPMLFLPYSLLPLLAAALAGISWYWYSRRATDLFMLACLVMAGCTIIVSMLLKAELFFYSGVGAVFLWGLIIVGLTAGAGKILLALQRQLEGEGKKRGTGFHENPVAAFFAGSRPVPSWEELRAHLKELSFIEADTPLPGPIAQTVSRFPPWYVRTMLAFGGWIAAVLFLLFLGLFLFITLKINTREGAALFFLSWAPLGVAYFCFKAPGDFSRHFGFSLALAGSAGACIGFVWGFSFGRADAFLCAALLAALCFVMNSSVYRFFAAMVIAQLVVVGILAQCYAGGWDLWLDPDAGRNSAYWVSSLLLTIWWAGLSAGLAALWIYGENRLDRPAWRILEPVFSGAYGGMMVFLLTSISARAGVWYGQDLGLDRIVLSSLFTPWPIGLGAAAGLVFLVRHLSLNKAGLAERWGIMACAALALPLGWFLPGAALAAFGLALSRYCGNRVMQGATASFLFVYMVYYYYFLDVTLFYKSLLLAGSGMVLLFLAFALDRLAGKRRDEVSHA